MDYYFENRSNPIEVRISVNLDCEKHLHDHIELGYVESGTSCIFVDGKIYRLGAGDFFIVFPNQIHSFDTSENLSCILSIFSPDLIMELRDKFTSYLPESSVIKGSKTDIETLMQLLKRNASTNIPELLHGIILALCGKAISLMNIKKLSKYDVDTLKNVLIYIEQNFTEPITAETVAENLHISASRLSHIFSDKLETTFTKYITAKRISYACRLLKGSDAPITEIAFRSGFNSVRTFNRAFISVVGSAPRDYRR